MIIVKVTRSQLEHGFDKLYDMINSCSSYDELHKLDGYRRMFERQASIAGDIRLQRRILSLSSVVITRISRDEMRKLKEA